MLHPMLDFDYELARNKHVFDVLRGVKGRDIIGMIPSGHNTTRSVGPKIVCQVSGR